ncbi:MAG TPA: SRPBCC domain-containing protein [Ignavibacteriaceae bacterium]|nr:SRPBCC domain-containing protein [Ignavibacteriaceae bacterium]
MNDEPVIVEQTFDTLPAKIWKAITDKEEMKKWYFNIKEFKPEKGFEFRFWAGKDEKNQYEHVCKITELIPEKKLTYSWRFESYEGLSFVTFELFPEGKKTRFKLTHAGLGTFPADNPDFARDNFVEGWNYIIRTSLKNYIEDK